ncbi:MAG: sialidase family protein [Anaerolineae bacterium]
MWVEKMKSGVFTRLPGLPRLSSPYRYVVLGILAVGIIFARAVAPVASQIAYPWSKPIDITQPSDSTIGAFGILLCDQYQNVHLLWSDLSDKGAAIFYRHDVEGGWDLPIDVLATGTPVAVYLDAAISNVDDVLHLVWQDAYIGGNLLYSNVALRNAGNARSWSAPQVLAQNTGAGSLAVDAGGTIHLVYGTTGAGGMRPMVNYIKSEDGGETWSEPIVIFSVIATAPSDIWGEIAADDTNRLYVGVTWRSQEYGVQSEVGYVLSADAGRTWSEYRRVEVPSVPFPGVSKLVPYAFGNEVHLTWHSPKRMHQWSSDGGITWSSPVEIMPLGAAFGGANHLAQDSAGNVHVVTAVADGVFSATWNGTQWGLPERIDDRYIDPHGQNMVVCQGNQLHVVYYDRTGDNTVWYAHRELAAPHIDRRPFPTPTPPAPVASTLAESQPTPQVTPTAVRQWSQATAPVVNPGASDLFFPLLASVSSVLALIALVFVLRRRLER